MELYEFTVHHRDKNNVGVTVHLVMGKDRNDAILLLKNHFEKMLTLMPDSVETKNELRALCEQHGCCLTKVRLVDGVSIVASYFEDNHNDENTPEHRARVKIKTVIDEILWMDEYAKL